jgi:hypothetical protein
VLGYDYFFSVLAKKECDDALNLIALDKLGFIIRNFMHQTFFTVALALDFIATHFHCTFFRGNVEELLALTASNHAPLPSEFDNLNSYLGNPSLEFQLCNLISAPRCYIMDDFELPQSYFMSLMNRHGHHESSEISCTVS